MTTPATSIGPTIQAMLSGSLPEPEILRFFDERAAMALTAEDLAAAASVMRSAMMPVHLGGQPIDTCGTGGSGKQRINTSTLVAFIVAAAGGQVAKHGNRAAGGRCGSFDLLEMLGATIDLTPEQESKIFKELGLVFLFAPNHHPAMRHVAAARKAYGKPTIFNLLGPLANPAGVRRQLIGTPSGINAALIANALKILGTEESWIVTGSDGLDEITVAGTTTILIQGGDERRFSPTDIRLPMYRERDIVGGTREQNAAIALDLAKGKGHAAHRDLVIVNAAHALVLAKIALTVQAGAVIASDLLRSRNIATLIRRYAEASNDLSANP